jgi:hypothetical protein
MHASRAAAPRTPSLCLSISHTHTHTHTPFPQAAVDACFACGRTSDALLIASIFSSELHDRPQHRNLSPSPSLACTNAGCGRRVLRVRPHLGRAADRQHLRIRAVQPDDAALHGARVAAVHAHTAGRVGFVRRLGWFHTAVGLVSYGGWVGFMRRLGWFHSAVGFVECGWLLVNIATSCRSVRPVKPPPASGLTKP